MAVAFMAVAFMAVAFMAVAFMAVAFMAVAFMAVAFMAVAFMAGGHELIVALGCCANTYEAKITGADAMINAKAAIDRAVFVVSG